MNRNTRTIAALLSTLGMCLILGTCVQDLAIGPGTGSETTNGIMAVFRYQDGSPAADATVKIRPASYLRDTGEIAAVRTQSIIDTTTDSLGRFSLRGIDTLDYVIEVLDAQKKEGAVVRGRAQLDKVADFGIEFLDPVGSISGTVDYTVIPESTIVFIQIYGLDRIERIDLSTGSFTINNIARGSYTLRLFTPHPSYMPAIIENVAVIPALTTMFGPVKLTQVSDWCCSKRVYLNTTPSGADVSVDLKNVPVLIRLDSGNFDFISAQTGGADIRFLKPDNTPMPYQIERWDAKNSRAEIWVKVDTVFGNNESQYFIMLWGNPDAASTENGGDVFDTAIGFQGVWHMNESDTSLIGDATDNRYNGRKYAMYAASVTEGMCGSAQRFDGTSSYIVLSNTASSKLNFPEDGNYSVSAWVYAEALDGAYHSIVSKSNQQYGLQLTILNRWQFFEFHNRVGWDGTDAAAVAKTWKYVTGVRSGMKQYLYVDGALVDSSITTTSDGSDRVTGDNVFIGRRTSDATRFWNGLIDEVRICSWSHSVNWIKLCYMNQKAVDELVVLK